METIRTTSGYFSPKSIIAPDFRASARGIVAERIGSPARIFSFTSSSIAVNSSARTAAGLAKSNRSRSSSTFEPCCKACSPKCFRKA